MCDNLVHVAVAVIRNSKDQILISKRLDHVHLGGYWEFPGGKVDPKESVSAALVREIKEEIDIEISQYRPLIKITHHYDDKSVLLDVWEVSQYTGNVKGNEGQEVVWKSIKDLDASEFPAANVAIIKAIKLPDYCLITGDFDSAEDFSKRLNKAVKNNIRLVQCRITSQHIAMHGNRVIQYVLDATYHLCNENDVMLIVNCATKFFNITSDNTHLKSSSLMNFQQRPMCDVLTASCHNSEELLKAETLGVDFVFLSPVNFTNTHPNAETLGWSRFADMIENVSMPVYALGGVGQIDLLVAKNAGAQGVAGIQSFW